MSNKDNKLTIYLDMECLLDLRLGRLKEINPVMEYRVLENFNHYCGRLHDDFWLMFPEITKEDYKQHVSTKETLKLSKRTNIFVLIDRLIECKVRNIHSADIDLTFYLNDLHYNLTEGEKERIGLLFSSRYEHLCKVKFVSKTPDKIKPQWLNCSVNVAIMYDLDSWLGLWMSTGSVTKVNRVCFYGPLRYPDAEAAEEGLLEHAKVIEKATDANAIESITGHIMETGGIELYLEDLRLFSAIAIG